MIAYIGDDDFLNVYQGGNGFFKTIIKEINMKKMKELVLFLMFFLPLLTMAESFGRIEGKVIDKKTGKPIPYANVLVKGTTLGSVTDLEGRYLVTNVSEGNYQIVATIIGYQAIIKKVEIPKDETVNLDFELVESAIEVEGIVITGTRTPYYIKDAPIRTEVISSQLIENKSAPNLYEALEGMPGIRVEQQCQYCNFSMVRLQGLGPDHTQVLIDGQPIYSGLASVYGLQQLSTADINRIEVVKGAGSALYGSSAVAGAINIITGKPSIIPKLQVKLQNGSYNTYDYSIYGSAKKGRIGVVLTAQNHGGDAIDVSGNGNTTEEVRNPDDISDRVNMIDFNAGFKLLIDTIFGNDDISLSGRVRNEIRRGGTIKDNTYLNPFTEGTENIITDRYETEVEYKKRFIYGNELNISFAYTLHNRNATNDAFLGDYMATHNDTLPSIEEMRPYIAKENIYAFNLNYLQSILSSNRVLLGLQYSHNNLTESGKYVVVDEGDSLYGIPYTSTSKKRADEVGAYIQDELNINDMFVAVGGIRYDWHKSEDNFRGSGKVAPLGVEPVVYNTTSLNPRFGIMYKLFSSLSLRASVGTGFRVPFGFSEDLHLCSGSPRVWKGDSLEPEKSISYNFSVDYSIGNKVFLSGNIYRTNLGNKIGFMEAGIRARSLGYTYEWKNIGKAYVQGVEGTVEVYLFKELSLSGNFTFNDGQFEEEREDWIGTPYQNISKYISRFPRSTGSAIIEFMPQSWVIVLEANYTGKMYIDYFEDEESPTKIKETEPFWKINTKISKKFTDKFELYLGVKNLTDYIQPERHMDDAAFLYAPVYGRILYGGINIKL